MEELDINPEFIGLFHNELMNIESNHINNEMIKNEIKKVSNKKELDKLIEYKKIKITHEEKITLEGIINLICDKNK